MSVCRAESLFLDPCPGQAGIALWFLKLVSPSLGALSQPEFGRDSWSRVGGQVSLVWLTRVSHGVVGIG